MLDAKIVEQGCKLLTVFGEVDGGRAGAKNWHVFLVKRVGEFQWRLAAELYDHSVQRAGRLLFVDNLQNMFFRQRLKIEPVRCIIVRGHRFRIAIDHDGLDADVIHRECGMTAAIVKLDALTDPVGAAPKDDRLVAI